jgi:isoleucyl-tRNA synthetase
MSQSRTEPTEKQDKSRYRATLNLPRTAFPMKANLVQNEPASFKRWQSLGGIGLYAMVRKLRAGAPRFVFHDGPPYANAGLHLGHMLNKSLKDFVVRSRTMMGMDCPFIPGWDCHGLPIEHRVMTELVESGKIAKLKELPESQRRLIIRRECQKHAEKFQKLQAGQMQRLLTLADYEHPYLTMTPDYEAATLEVLAALLEQGLVYRALKPVHWSIANETALAEAELEYYDREDVSIYVDFEADDTDAVYDAFGLPRRTEADDEDNQPVIGEPGAPLGRPDTRPSFMIWTTTPWTLPANLAIAVNPDLIYALVFVDGNIAVVAQGAVERITQMARAEDVRILATCKGFELVGLKYRHPFVSAQRGEGAAASGQGSAATFTIVAADYVTLEDGTGLVHTAPGHGQEDFDTGRRVGLPVYSPVRHDGTYDDTVPPFIRNLDIWKANDLIVQNLRESGHLFFDHKFTHSYPHDWRSKTPVIFRCTEQWFIGVDLPLKRDGQTLRQLGLAAAEREITFIPEWGRHRMRGMLEARPDWCISRQRAWGLPIPAFQLSDGQMFMTAASVRAIIQVVRQHGSDIWFTAEPAELLKYYNPAEDPEAPPALADPGSLSTLKKGPDIIDVWFESGSSWNAVMRQRSGGRDFPVELYLEGADQHRGWFQSSLLPGLGMMGTSPYRAVLTHGFTVNREGRKLSKSKGDTLDDLFADYGVDVLRWWVAAQSYESDMKVDRELFDLAGESYRKVRNTLRFMLSNLDGFEPARLTTAHFPPASLEAWVLAEYDRIARDVVHAYQRYDFQSIHKSLYDFCNETLSATYLAAIKDRLYCDSPASPRRQRTQAALWMLTDGLCRLLAPILCHTADEAFRTLQGDTLDGQPTCVHLEAFIEGYGIAADPAWDRMMKVRDQALAALEKAKAAPQASGLGVENPLDAGIILPDEADQLARFDPVDLADLLGVSQAQADHRATAVQVRDLRDLPRCERSWKRDGTVRQRSDGGWLTDRDAAAVGVS